MLARASLLVLILSVFCSRGDALQFRQLGVFPVADASFLNLNPYTNGTLTTWVLSISTFGIDPLAADNLYVVDQLEDKLNDFSSIVPTLLSTQIDWPNEAAKVPNGVFKSESLQDSLAVAGGFLVPGKSTGAINLFTNLLNGPQGPFQISINSEGWFYHSVRWRDMNGDGLEDAVSARAYKSFFGGSGGEFLYYEQPASDPLGGQGTWNQTVLFNGPDIFFEFYDIDQDGNDEMIATQFFSNVVVVYWNTNGNWSQVQSNVIDNSIGAPFKLAIVDVNNDGTNDLLVSNHVDDPNLSGVYAYTIPKNWKTENWPRHNISTGFVVTEPGRNQAAPGAAIPFWPETALEGKTKPWILLAGDGSQDAYLITPNSENGDDWSYTTTTVLKGAATVGQLAVADVNGDGYSEFFIPLWDTGLVYGYTFAP